MYSLILLFWGCLPGNHGWIKDRHLGEILDPPLVCIYPEMDCKIDLVLNGLNMSPRTCSSSAVKAQMAARSNASQIMIIVSWWNSDRWSQDFPGVRQPGGGGGVGVCQPIWPNFHWKGHENEKIERKWSFFIKWYFSIKNKYYLANYCPMFHQGNPPHPTPSSPAPIICDERIHAQLCLATM